MRPIIQVLVRAKSHPHRLPGCPHLPRHRLGDFLIKQRQDRRGDLAEFAVFDEAVEAVSLHHQHPPRRREAGAGHTHQVEATRQPGGRHRERIPPATGHRPLM